MQIKYTSTSHQSKAISSIVNIFTGQIKQTNDYNIFDAQAVVQNSLTYDSNIEQEFIKCADRFKIFTKLPTKFKIKTPFGNYSPDFAVITYDKEESGFIVETKGSEKDRDLKGVEKWKLAYAKKHFEALEVKYKDKIIDCKSI